MNTRDPAKEIVDTAEAILNGCLGIIEGARRLMELRSAVTVDHLDNDFVDLLAIDSETDTLPVGAVRALWSRDELARKDAETEEAETLYREVAFNACRRLIARFGERPRT